MNFDLESKQFRPIEQELKKLFLAYPSRHLDKPCMKENIDDILNLAFQKSYPNSSLNMDTTVNEHTFINDSLDAAFVKHSRYLPAFQHKHDFFELLYVIDGHCVNTIFQQNITMSKGDICIIAPGIIHAVSAFSDDDIILNIVIRKSTFENSFFGLLEGDDILSDFFKRAFYQTTEIPYLMFHTGISKTLPSYVSKAYREYQKNNRFKKQMINSILSEFFIVLFREHEQNISLPSIHMNRADENLMFILRYMQSNFTTVSLKEMSKFFNYSERQLQRLILNATGMTFRENIQKQKMTKAAELLLRSTLPISKICEQLGFQSSNNFRKIFFHYYQMTPSDFRKNKPYINDELTNKIK